MDIIYLYFFDSHGMSREKECLGDSEVARGDGKRVKTKWWRWLLAFVSLDT